ncbi:MAG: beta-N-acetylhexosaminidase [Deltaproteobacteria bacterium]|nr:beta-N-acetylhexosaminidase [Deltaproteobacteria bacterium]
MEALDANELSLEQLCGQLIVGGFAATELSPRFARELSAGRRAGAILFRRNIGSIDQVARLNRSIVAAAPRDLPPFIAVDQEGGRVARLGSPFLKLPPMRQLGRIGQPDLTERVAAELGAELSVLGFNLDFAPVMDVDSNPENPVIGDRSFGREPAVVAAQGLAVVRGLQGQGVLACAKHFPGHGDTSVDSHLALPVVTHDRNRLDQVELPPFRAAARAGVAAMMSAHVVFPALDGAVPATFSPHICTTLLRREIGFDGLLFTDDLEMGAVAADHSIEQSAVRAVEAGCDVLLICSDEDLQTRAHRALVQRAEREGAFADRCRAAVARSLGTRAPHRARPGSDEAIAAQVGGAQAGELLAELAAATTGTGKDS